MIEILYDDLGTGTRVNLHLKTFILIVQSKRVASDYEFFEGDKISCTNEVVLILHCIIREIHLDEGGKVPCS
jgi:hypothetical protein